MNIHLKVEGNPQGPVLLFSNSLGANLHMWDEVVPFLLSHFSIIRYDTRGLGRSTVSPGPYTIAQLGQDVLDILDEQGHEKVHFCGLSMGGQIGQWLGIHHPDRIHKLVLSNTAAKIGRENRWNARIRLINQKGLGVIWEGTQKVWFREAFIQQKHEKMLSIKEMFLSHEVEGYIACCAAVRDADFREEISQIYLPTLIIAGEEDTSTTVEEAKYMAEKMSDSQLVVLPARHISCVEHPQMFANNLINFLT
ncbi:MAG: 3-oxoadipate enol-lactonase [Bacteroidota bacterium]